MGTRVAVFTDNDFEKVNGVTTALDALLTHAPPDIAPRIYTAAALGAETPTYLALSSTPVPIPFYRDMAMYVPRWREYLRRVVDDRIDVIHLTTPGPIGLTALWIAARTGLPLVGSFHTDLASYTRMLSGSKSLGRLMSHYMRWMYGRCGQTLVPSTATRDLIIAAGSRPDRIGVWTRGVDAALFSPDRRSARLRERWRASEHDQVLLYVGRISREKGLEALPDLLYRVRALGAAHRMVVVGDGPLRRWLSDQMPDAIFTGWLGRAQVADAFASSDLFVFPSATDTAGNVVLEAQASGLPVVVSDRGGPQENMRPGITGRVCEFTNVKAWAEALADLITRPAHRRQMSHAARQYALERRWESALTTVYQAYRSAAAGVARPALVKDAA